MKELYAKVSMEDWQESGGPLELSCQEVGLALKRDEVKEGFFDRGTGAGDGRICLL